MSTSTPAKPDFSTWYLKQQAAEAIGISTKQLDRWAEEKKLQRHKWKRPGGGPLINVYHPGDVDRLAQSRNQTVAFVLPDDGSSPAANGTETSHAVARRQPSAEQLLQVFSAVSEMSRTQRRVSLDKQRWHTIPEAAEFLGLGVKCLRDLITEGKLALVKGKGPRGADVLDRVDLEKLEL
jgi:hypothetical protein